MTHAPARATGRTLLGALLALVVAMASCTAGSDRDEAPATIAPGVPSPAPEVQTPAPTPELRMQIRAVEARGVDGRVRRNDLATQTRAIRQT
ncbi:MAG: hypothetical protein ACRDGW_11260, partial [Actinomycetota bacterium]